MAEALIAGAGMQYASSLLQAGQAGANRAVQDKIRKHRVRQVRLQQANVRRQQRRAEAKIINRGGATGLITQVSNDADSAILEAEMQLGAFLQANRREAASADNSAIAGSVFQAATSAVMLAGAASEGAFASKPESSSTTLTPAQKVNSRSLYRNRVRNPGFGKR